MKGALLPPKDNIARYCGGSHINEDDTIAPTAFHLRHDQNEEYLSVDWLEILNQQDRITEIEAVRSIISQRLRPGRTSKIVTLNVGEVIDQVIDGAGLNIRILHEPLPNEPSHSGIYDTDQDEECIAELIAKKVNEIYPTFSS